MLNLKNATFSYGKKNIINNLSLDFYPGTTSLLLGQNGIGKTTMLKLIAGLNFLDSGTISINEQDVQKRTVESLKNIRYVAETPEKYQIPINQYLKLHQQAFGLDVEKISSYLTQANINLTTDVKFLSTGQNKLFFLLLAFYSDAKVLLLDEPINGLDIQNQVLFYNILEETNKKKDKIVLVSTHHLLDIPQSFNAITILGVNLYSPVLNLKYLEENYIIDYEKNILNSGMLENVCPIDDLEIIQQSHINSDRIIIAKLPKEVKVDNKINIQALYLMYLMYNKTLDNYLSNNHDTPIDTFTKEA